jgi:hypothetical protein
MRLGHGHRPQQNIGAVTLVSDDVDGNAGSVFGDRILWAELRCLVEGH